jgi:N6-L-threonylcarbamoyladenine synthase
VRILAIETSCDETSVAITDFSRNQVRVLSHIILSQIPVHKKFGGVVPNLTKREHQRNLVPILLQTLKEAGWLKKSKIENRKSKLQIKIQNAINKILEREPELSKQFKNKIVPMKPPPIDAIAVTYGPGLAPALWVGVNFAKALACLWQKPLVRVNHMAGHFFSAFLKKSGKENSKFKIQNSKFPILGLLVSGGHTELVLVKKPWKFKVIGETLDDAAGEAFDKTARILGLNYPGGPEISRLAEMEIQSSKSQITNKFKIRLPRPMINSKDYNFSFSGLKTAVLYLVRDLGHKKAKRLRPLIAKEFQDAVVEVLVKKTIRAAKKYKVKTVLLGGGVAANKLLRYSLTNEIKRALPDSCFMLPDSSLTGDNALMIAAAAYFYGKKKSLGKIVADANAHLL